MLLEQYDRLEEKKRVTHLNTNLRHLNSVYSYFDQQISKLGKEEIPPFVQYAMRRFDKITKLHWPSHCKFSDNLAIVFQKRWLRSPPEERAKKLFWLNKALDFVKNLRDCYMAGQQKEGIYRTIEKCYTPLYTWAHFLYVEYRELQGLPGSLVTKEFLEVAKTNLLLMDTSSLSDDILIQQIRLLLANIYAELEDIDTLKSVLSACKTQGQLEYMSYQVMWSDIKQRYEGEEWWTELLKPSSAVEVLPSLVINFSNLNVSHRASDAQMKQRRIVKVKRKKYTTVNGMDGGIH